MSSPASSPPPAAPVPPAGGGWASFAVQRPQFTLILFVMVALLGLNALVTIPKAEDPSFPIPTFLITTVVPGASPEEMERRVVIPMERALRTLDRLKKVRATAVDGVAAVRAEFEYGVDIDRTYSDVLREVERLRGSELPAELLRLEVDKFETTDTVVFQWALTSATLPYAELDTLTRRFRDRLESVPGIRDADRWALPPRQMQIILDPAPTAALGISLGEVLGAVQSAGLEIPGGSIDAGGRRFNVQTDGGYEEIERLRQLPVRSNGTGLVRLSDLGEVRWDYGEHRHQGRYNGGRAVFVTATLRGGSDIFQVRETLKGPIEAFRAQLPGGVELVQTFDQSENVAKRLNGLGIDFLIANALVAITLLPLGFRAALVVMISIPLSLAVGLLAVALFGYNINQLTVVGLVIALGLVVDDSIVVIENIARNLRLGMSRRDAAIRGVEQIALAVIGSTIILVLAFVPLAALPGASGAYIRSLPMAVISSVVGSLLVALTIIPFLASCLLDDKPGQAEGNIFLRLLNRVIHITYSPILHYALRHRWAALGLSVVLMGACFALLPVVGVSLFPKAETPNFLITITTPEGSTRAEADRATRWVEAQLTNEPKVAWHLSMVGRGHPPIFYNIIEPQDQSNYAEVQVKLHKYEPGATAAWIETLRPRLAAYAGAEIQVEEFVNGPPVDAPIAVRVTGENLDTLRALAARTEKVLSDTTGTQYVDNPLSVYRYDLQVDVDEDRAAQLGLPVAEINRAVRLALEGLEVATFRDRDGEAYPVTVTFPRGERPTLDTLQQLYLHTRTGQPIPLTEVATIRFEEQVPVIERYQRERTVILTAFVREGFNTARVTDAVQSVLQGQEWPTGFKFTMAGEVESREESFGGIGSAIIFTVFATLAVLILEFKSFKNTLIVASVIPLGAMGGVLALWLTGNTLSFTATIGFVALIGIEIKTSILLVDLTNQLRREGKDILTAVQEAGEIRFVPILLTATTAIGGLLPIAWAGTALYSPLAWVIIGGLVTSTLFARVVTPVLYVLVAPNPEA